MVFHWRGAVQVRVSFVLLSSNVLPLLLVMAKWAVFFFSSRRRHTRLQGDWSSDVCSSDLSRRRHTDYKVTGVQTCALPICRARAFHLRLHPSLYGRQRPHRPVSDE